MSQKIIAHISSKVIQMLNLDCKLDEPIYIGDSNIEHMKEKHPADYEKYHDHISDILSAPDYVALNKKNNSLEYVKEFKFDDNFVKVAVRVSKSGRYFARSMYVLNTRRVLSFITNGTLKKIDKNT